jgi:hypothetical protein
MYEIFMMAAQMKKPPEGGLKFLVARGGIEPGPRMLIPDDPSNNQLPKQDHYHLGR